MTEVVTVPDFIDYPNILPTKEYKEIFNNVYGYFIEPYPLDGYSIYCGLKNGHFVMRVADFKSKVVNISDASNSLKNILVLGDKIGMMMKIAKIPEFLMYFSNVDDPMLVDIMLSLNKFAGPGFLRDLFGRLFKTQSIIEIATFNDETVKKYDGKYFKPSLFKFVNKDNKILPVYGKIINEVSI